MLFSHSVPRSARSISFPCSRLIGSSFFIVCFLLLLFVFSSSALPLDPQIGSAALLILLLLPLFSAHILSEHAWARKHVHETAAVRCMCPAARYNGKFIRWKGRGCRSMAALNLCCFFAKGLVLIRSGSGTVNFLPCTAGSGSKRTMCSYYARFWRWISSIAFRYDWVHIGWHGGHVRITSWGTHPCASRTDKCKVDRKGHSSTSGLPNGKKRADRGSDPPENPKKTIEKTIYEPTHLQTRFSSKKYLKLSAKIDENLTSRSL